MERARRLAIVTQDPANYGGVLRLAEYIYKKGQSIGMEPALLHYGRFEEHPAIQASAANLLRGEINLRPSLKKYLFREMKACAIGAFLPEWEPNRLRANKHWKAMLDEFDAFLLVTGSAQTGLPLAECNKHFAAWVSSTVEADRSARLSGRGLANVIERMGLPSVKAAEARTLHAAEPVLAVSADAAAHIQPIAGKRVDVWPYPIDTTKFSPHSAGSKHSDASNLRRFLFVGRANDPRKRVDLFLDACALLHRTHPKLALEAVIVSRELQLPDSIGFPVRHVPFAKEPELIALYRSATALIVTSEQEGLNIAALEAMACGLPVISTKCGGPEMFIDDGISGFLAEDSCEPIAKRMAEVALDAERQRELGAAACNTVESRFSEHGWNAKFETLLLSM